MRPSIALMVVACWSTPCTIAAAQPRCIVISGTADALGKNNAVEKSLKSLREAIDKWKTDNNVTGPVRETPHKPTPNPYWRSSISPHLLLPPDVVSDSAHTICWAGVVSPVVCTSGAQLCW